VSASAEAIREVISGTPMLLVVAGLGGGTGSGGVKVVARLARDAGVPALFLLTLPFAFEGHSRRRQAMAVLGPLREVTDAAVVVQNDLMFTTLPADTPAPRAFDVADDILGRAVSGLAAVARAQWLLMADFAAMRSVLRQHPDPCYLGVGIGRGEDRWQEAVRSFIECPFVGGAETLARAEAAVITLLGGSDMSVGELQTSLSAIQERFPDTARVLVGACADAATGDEIQITGIICRGRRPYTSDREPPAAAVREAPEGVPPGRDGRKPAVHQGELPFQEQTLGIFSSVPATTVRGENLDVPTYQRRGIHLDVGD
jgi:cell division protein FtsZ